MVSLALVTALSVTAARAQSEEPVVAAEVRVVHSASEGFQVVSSTFQSADGTETEKLVLTTMDADPQGGALVLLRDTSGPAFDIDLSEISPSEVMTASWPRLAPCGFRCRCQTFLDTIRMQCNGVVCGSCQECVLKCPAAPPTAIVDPGETIEVRSEGIESPLE
jgi:hypothetical protein